MVFPDLHRFVLYGQHRYYVMLLHVATVLVARGPRPLFPIVVGVSARRQPCSVVHQSLGNKHGVHMMGGERSKHCEGGGGGRRQGGAMNCSLGRSICW